MGAHWSELTTEQLVAELRKLGSAYEAFAVCVEEYGLNGKTVGTMTFGKPLDNMDGLDQVLSSCDLAANIPQKCRLLQAIQSSQHDHPKPDAGLVQTAVEKARHRVAIATATAAANAINNHFTTTTTSTTSTTATESIDGSPLSLIREFSAAQLQQMPKAVREFQPLIETVYIAALCCSVELASAEARILADAGDAEAVATINLLVQRLQTVVRHEIERRLSLVDTPALVRAVADAGNQDFKTVYTAVWERCAEHDPTGIQQYTDAVRRAIEEASQHQALAQQQAGSVAELLQHASQSKAAFDNFVHDIVRKCCSSSHPHHQADVPQAKLPETLKKVSRIVEKLQLHPNGPTSSVGHIFDVVRGMIRCQSMGDVALVIEKVTDCDAITIVRVKDRFVDSPTAGGWRDCQICFFLNGDENKHVCELQVVHEHLYNNRANLPGHLVYGRVRNAQEILDVLLNGDASSVRAGLRARLAELEAERDQLTSERDQFKNERDQLRAELEAAAAKVR